MTRFNVGDILEPVNYDDVPENERKYFYYLVKRVKYGTYDVENIATGERLYGMEMVLYRRIP